MTARKPRKRTPKGASRKKTRSLAARRTVRSMNYWYARISGDDMMRYWNTLRVFARVVKHPIISDIWASGITGAGDFRVGATASITRNGFALRFTERGTSK